MIRNTIVVKRPIDEVFGYAAQFDRHPEWQEDLKAATIDGPAALGVTGTETRKMGPRVHTYQWRVSAYEPPHHLGFETLSGPMRPAGTMDFVSDGDGTRIDFQMELNPRGVMKLLSPMIERNVQKVNTQHLEKFKEILEGS
jgi:uncharacterized membrane protein